MRSIVIGAVLVISIVSSGCVTTHHPSRPSALGVPSSSRALAAVVDQPGLVTLETVTSSTWAVPREHLINFAHPAAKAAHLQKGPEPIEVDFHVLRHPTRGTFIVDTGVERALRDAPSRAAVRGLVASVLHFATMKVTLPLGDWIAAHAEPIQGVFLTHLHPDHISGMADVPASAIVYTGPGEARETLAHNLVLAPINDRALAGKPPLQE